TAVAERPIIMSADSVRAVLAGTKTQTRRGVKAQPSVEPEGRMHWHGNGGPKQHDRLTGPSGTMLAKCPFGRPGHRLWVRETWRMSLLEHVPAGRPATPGGTWGVPAYPHWNPCVVYRADGEIPQPPDGIEVARWSPP